MRLALMIEGQEGVTWDDWVSLAKTCETAGIEALMRSDHYGSGLAYGEREALDAWTTIAGLSALTSALRFGTLVSPATFRHPSVLARSVVTADHISGGRVELGLGAGWMEKEHTAFGFELAEPSERLDVLAEQAEIIVRQWTEDAYDFAGDHYRLDDARALPKPVQDPCPPVIIGGHGGPRSAAIAARWADEYNTLVAGVEECRERRAVLDAACEQVERDPEDLPMSLMSGCVVGEEMGQVRERVARMLAWLGRDLDPDEFISDRRDTWVIGTVDDAVAQLERFAEAGVERVMLQDLLHEDLDMIRLIGEELVPAVG